MSQRLKLLMGMPRLLLPFVWDPARPETVDEFCALLRSIDYALPLDPSGLDTEEVSYSIWYATSGLPAWIMKLIGHAAYWAIQSGETKLSRSLLARAYDDCIAGTLQSEGKINPFTAPYPCELQVARERQKSGYSRGPGKKRRGEEKWGLFAER